MRAWLLLLLPATAAAQGFSDSLDEAFVRDVLVIEAAEHACLRFDVYLALDRPQKTRGLMFVRDLPETTGMLFVYTSDDFHSMWMKNTFIPLDIAFAAEDGRIATIARNTEPQSLATIAPAEPVRYVLELNAGVTERLAIEEGSRLVWGPIFGMN